MTRWAILDGDPAPGDPSAVGRLARQFGRAAEDFREGRARLHRMMAGSAIPSWQGPAATAFAGGLEPLRDDLGSAADSFEEASAALSAYSRILDTLQTQALGLLAQANQAQQRIDDANLALARAASNADREIALQGLDPLAAMIYRRQIIAPHQQAVSQAEEWLRSVRSQAQDLRREHEAAARRAADGLGHATNVGIHETFRDRTAAFLAGMEDLRETIAPAAMVVGLASLGLAAIILTGGTAAPIFLVASIKLGVKATVLVNLADVSARIARRGLGDETMTDSNAQLGVDLALVALSVGSMKMSAVAVDKGQVAINKVQTAGYTTRTYQSVNAAHQSMNQALALKGIDAGATAYKLRTVEMPRSIEHMTDWFTPGSVYEPLLPSLTPPVTTDPVPGPAPTDTPQAPLDTPLQSPPFEPNLQSGFTAPALQGDREEIPGLQQVSPASRATVYRRPIEVRT